MRETASTPEEANSSSPAEEAISECEAASSEPSDDRKADADDDYGLLLDLVLAAEAERSNASQPPQRIDGVVVGRIVGFAPSGEVLVTFPGDLSDEGLPARSAVVLGADNVGREVALMFEGGEPSRPLIIGPVVVPPTPLALATGSARQPNVHADGERLEITAEREIVLRCGKASITLTRAGKIIVRGAYVSTRSSGLNRVQGASVQIN